MKAVSSSCLSTVWNSTSLYLCQHNYNIELPHAKRFTTSPPIITFSTLCAQGSLRPFEKENPFVKGEIESEKEGRGLERKRRESERFDMEWEKHVRKCKPVTACTRSSAPASARMYGHVPLSIWTIVCLPQSEPECPSCSKSTPTGGGICDLRGKKRFAYCSLS